MDETLVIAIEKVKIIEVSQAHGTAVLVTFSDGRVTTMESDDIYEDSLELSSGAGQIIRRKHRANSNHVCDHSFFSATGGCLL